MDVLTLDLPPEFNEFHPGDDRLQYIVVDGGQKLVLGRMTTPVDLAAFYFLGLTPEAADLCRRPETARRKLAQRIQGAGCANSSGQEINSWSSTLLRVHTPFELRPEIAKIIAATAQRVPRLHPHHEAALS